MKNLTEYLQQNLTGGLLMEFKQDLQPQVVVVMGNPAAGKTTFMNNGGLSRLLKREIQSRKLDSDNNLKVEQLESCNNLAKNILVSCNSWSANDGSKKEQFRRLIEDTQKAMDEASDKGGSPRTDLSQIDFDFCKGWISRYEKAAEEQKDKVISDFQRAFQKQYFATVFASDFSRRSISKAQYKKDFQAKLRGIREIGDSEFVSPTDVAVAITGDDIEKIDQIVEVAQEMGAVVTVVYLDCSIERSIRNDAKRDRSVGEDMIRKKAEGVKRTWNELVKTFKDHGVFRMYQLVESPRSTEDSADYTIGKEYVNPFSK